MTDLYLDQITNDITIEDGDLVFIDTEQELCRQAVVGTLKTFRGEWFRDIEYGVPWLENENNPLSILGKSNSIFYDSQIREAVLSNEQVLSIISYKSSKDNITGRVSIEIVVESNSGPVDIQTTV